MQLIIDINIEEVASEINLGVGKDVETPETVKLWIDDNPGMLPSLLEEAILQEIAKGYG